MTCFLKTIIYESGIAVAWVDERMGAASLWMVSMRTGDADASKGSNDKAKSLFMMKEISNRSVVNEVMKGDEEGRVVDGGWLANR